MSGVAFTTRLQMYPRIEQLLVPLTLLVTLPILHVGDGVANGGFAAFFCGLALWAAAPDLDGYRSFGVPVRCWIVDALIAVHGVFLLFLGLWGGTGAGAWGLAGIVIAYLAVLLRLAVATHSVRRGDELKLNGMNQSTAGRQSLTGRIAASPGPVPWRLVYFPMALMGLAVALVTVLVAWGASMYFDGITMIGPALFVYISASPVALNILSTSYRGMVAMGSSRRTWVAHAHVGALTYVGSIALTFVVSTEATGLVSGLRQTSAEGTRAVLVGGGLLLLAAVMVRGSLAGNGGVVGLCVMSLFALSWLGSPELVESTSRALLTTAIILVLILVAVRSSFRRTTKGNRLIPPGPFTQAERNHHQRQGAL